MRKKLKPEKKAKGFSFPVTRLANGDIRIEYANPRKIKK